MMLLHILVVLCYLKIKITHTFLLALVYTPTMHNVIDPTIQRFTNPRRYLPATLRCHLYCLPLIQPFCSREMLRIITFYNFRSFALFDIARSGQAGISSSQRGETAPSPPSMGTYFQCLRTVITYQLRKQTLNTSRWCTIQNFRSLH
jgi:hypothetical protein